MAAAIRGWSLFLKKILAINRPSINTTDMYKKGCAAFQWAFDFSTLQGTKKIAKFFFGNYAMAISL
jgi:hypothetical protein